MNEFYEDYLTESEGSEVENYEVSKEEKDLITVRLEEGRVEQIEQLIEEDQYDSVSDVIREAVERKTSGRDKKTGTGNLGYNLSKVSEENYTPTDYELLLEAGIKTREVYSREMNELNDHQRESLSEHIGKLKVLSELY